MVEKHRQRLSVLCILDGWGVSTKRKDNAIAQARTPVWDALLRRFPHAKLDASEHHVGLPDGQMGNSEVGHMTLGSGRIVLQDLPRIDTAIKNRSLASNALLQNFISKLKSNGGTAHLMGLMSPGGVHAHQNHIAALANLITNAGVTVAVHAFLDGRDTPPKSAINFIADFGAMAPDAYIATVTGRYYAMDRDARFDRTARAYAALVDGEGERAVDVQTAITTSYADAVTDEFVRPTLVADYEGMRDGDGLLMANFRVDRARQILSALCLPDFTAFSRKRVVQFSAAIGMVAYSHELNHYLGTLFSPQPLANTLGSIVAAAELKQLRIAETEKYAHVTFFFNGGEETKYQGEERILVPSPKVATYDLKPEMSAAVITDHLVESVKKETFDLIVVNYANTDMVGHTGNLNAAIRAVETVDTCLGRLIEVIDAVEGIMLITADHGNAETMSDPTSAQAHTAHTCNQVPIVLVGDNTNILALEDGTLADVAPTLLGLMGLQPPMEMTGHSLITHNGDSFATD